MAINHAAFILVFMCLPRAAETASFYGDSHVSLPFSDASSSTAIQLRFKTRRQDGLLLLAAGAIDYFSVSLNGGVVQLRADFGSGEVVLNSSPDVRLSDGRWHQVSITRNNAVNTLQVDTGNKLSAVSPGQLFELNIQNAIYLGGTGSFQAPSGIEYKYFRGCMSNVVFNRYNIISAAQMLQGMEKTFKVSWDCDEEFDATITDPISFTTNTSFVAFPHLHVSSQGFLSLELKTKSHTSLLVFNSGHGSTRAGLVAVELVEKRIQLVVDRGEGEITVKSDTLVSDGRWHQVQVRLYADHVMLEVDGGEERGNFQPGSKNYFSLRGHLFIGGVGLHGTEKAIRKNLKSIQGTKVSSTLGCVRNIHINSRPLGFPHIQISESVSSTCEWMFPCSADPCSPEEICVEEGNTFRCSCDVDSCQGVRKVPSQQDAAADQGRGSTEEVKIIAVHALEVKEGSQQVITTDNIKVVFDHQSYGIRESAIQFHIVTQPSNGRIENTLGRRRNSNVFTLLDLQGNKIYYQHEGSESPADEVTLEMDVISDNENIPEELIRRYAFVLPIIIIPVPDPPVLTILNNGLIKLVKTTKIPVSETMLMVDDPDTEPDNLVYTVMCTTNSQGFFERYSDPDQPISTFTQQEVTENMIWFANKGESLTSCQMSLTDGSNFLNDIALEMEGVILSIQRTVNEGARLVHGSFVVFSQENMLVETNVPTQDLEIQYEITQHPSYGQIQRLHLAEERWIPVSTFAQRHINKGQVRYIHTDLTNLRGSDQFAFIVSCMDQQMRRQVFTIELESVSIDVVTSDTIRIVKGNYKKITSNELWVLTNNENVAQNEISFTLLRAPIHGKLYKAPNNMPLSKVFSSTEPLHKSSVFTLQDIEKGGLVYQLSRNYYSSRHDFMDLKISAPGARPKIKRFHMEFVPEEQDVRFVINRLEDVIEGGQRAIERSHLYLETMDYREFEYTLVRFPKHGVLQIVDPHSTAVMKSNISRFTNEDVRNLKLVYKHDDSETDTDSFTFTALPIIKNLNQLPTQVNEISDTLEINIMMRNDNPPVRLVDKVLGVVTDQEKVITLDDLAFTDPDIDYDTDQLMYTRRGIPNGEIVYTTNKTTTYQFSQKDIKDGLITFQHSGDPYGRTVIWVSDGQYYTTSLLEIQASTPEISLSRNTGLLVNNGQATPITSQNLSVETNINITPDLIRFVMIEEPLYGQLTIGEQVVTEFTLDDLISGRVMYTNRGSSVNEDMFKFAAVAGNVQVQGQFAIRVFIKSRQHPPRIVHNEILEVMETGVATLTQSVLLASHTDSLPSMIVFVVKTSPQYGELLVDNRSGRTSFTQAEVNEGRVKYSHSREGLEQDSFMFEVTNRFQTLRGLEFIIQAIPTTLHLYIQNLTVREGGRKVLTPSMLRLQGRYYDGKDTVFEIINQARQGWVEHVRARGQLQRLTSFSSDDLQQGAIFFVHDNGEMSSDQMTVQARIVDEGKESNTAIMFIRVETINDQSPQIVVNSGLDVWRRSITVITPDVLQAEDVDTGPEFLTYSITQPTNGRVALLNNTYRPISSFTQALINAGQVIYEHKGDYIGGFNFHVSDGVNGNSRPRRFEVRARALMLELVNNRQLNVYPGQIKQITKDHLYTRTNDPNQERPILYNLASSPRKGRMVTMFKDRAVEVQSFQQEDINNGNIFYEHTGTVYGWSQVDLFFFEVSTLYADSLSDEMFDISVSYRHLAEGEISDLIQVSDVAVGEGEMVALSRDNLDVSSYLQQLQHDGRRASIEYVLDTLPRHGTLEMDGQSLRMGQIFQQEKIDSGKITYDHDDSDTLLDSFTVILNIQNLDEEDRQTDEEIRLTVNITIEPLNDERFEVITREPEISVVQGLQAYITSDDLKTIDPDTQPQEIVYDVTAPPQNGFISYIASADTPISRFSQKDVDDRKIIFSHDGSGGSSSFRLRVSDGAFPAMSKVFVINVIPMTLDFVGNKTAWLLQGQSQVRLGADVINIRTNGMRNNLMFNVTKQPMYGELFKGQTISVSQFSQMDVDSSVFGYRQQDMSSHMDYFMCDVFYPNTALLLRSQRLTVMVRPLVRQRPLVAIPGTLPRITLNILDARELANITNSNPHYEVIDAPRFGKLLYHMRSKRDTSDSGLFSPIDSFTHEDVASERVMYQPDSGAGTSWDQDSFTFLLTAPGVQPAKGTFHIGVNPNKGKVPLSGSVTVTPRSPHMDNDTDGGVTPKQLEVVSPNVSSDFVIVIAILIPLLVLIVIVTVIVFILWRKRHEGDYLPGAQKYLRPYNTGSMHQIDQPHVHIAPQSPLAEDQTRPTQSYYNVPVGNGAQSGDHTYNGYSHSELSPNDWELQAPLLDSSRTEVSPTVPECKVTPLGHEDVDENLSLAPSATDKSTTSLDLYNWSLSDPEFIQHCRTTTPVLRENQYWV
ncbi:chondroitin sulfate proteoglycan 4-like [Mizuhopecten yessoensis]|uniref:Chondroitin sulfate proteoglycan 4 n=1 Tax=Mizuhopecten yessoensis TaxID=6573 RepID=A0A210QZ84_MIZYE|nr:chondroitin sulfate proteoglycan 4-like [Mizuhopecten yessoensis]OWF54066.1 Chondroitin sulfate proteoglycan 4 [Mizuhopecten yessoensis]